MGQSASHRKFTSDQANVSPTLSIFPTDFGWFGILGQGKRVQALWIGHSSAEGVRAAARQWLEEQAHPAPPLFDERDWHPELRNRLLRYCAGHVVTFDGIDLDLPAGTPFQSRIVAVTRKIPYGETVSYGDLAGRAGFPRAARAVGTVMSTNRFPILIPCHRVVASGGKLGGYTSPRGTDLKVRLLALEAEGLAAQVTSRPAVRKPVATERKPATRR